jgi:hypothetical protein
MKTMMVIGSNDFYTQEEDYRRLEMYLPSDKKVLRIDDYNCMDYLWALDAKDKIYKDILELLND